MKAPPRICGRMKMIQKQSNQFLVAIIICAAFLLQIPRPAKADNTIIDDGANLVGNWTGESICVGPFPACHDEKVVYRIQRAPDAKGNVSITADKIVNGKPELMGVLDFKYDPEKSTLVCDFTRGNTHGLWEFTVKGDSMEGTLVVLPDKTLARRVKLKKDPSTPSVTPRQ